MSKLVIKNMRRNWETLPMAIELAETENIVLTIGDKKIFTQAEEKGGKKYIITILPDMKKGEETECEIEKSPDSTPIVNVKDDGKGQVDVFINETLFTSYHYSNKVVRPYLNPVIGPEGKSVVRKPVPEGNPEKLDHKHHRGILVAHGDVNGTDNWSEEEGHGKTIHKKFIEVKSGPVFGKIHSLNDWVDNKDKKLLEEERIIIVYNLPENSRIIDHTTILRASEREVVFGDTKESGLLSVRVVPSMNVTETGTFENSLGGVNEGECWGKRASWCDYYGEVENTVMGISVFDHPENLRYPTWWHIRNYGLMTANFFGLSYFSGDKTKSGTYILPAYKELKLLHRIYIHPGNTAYGKVREKYLNFLYPPETEIK